MDDAIGKRYHVNFNQREQSTIIIMMIVMRVVSKATAPCLYPNYKVLYCEGALSEYEGFVCSVWNHHVIRAVDSMNLHDSETA